ncbi:PREDICTED: uncharacterized protein LOC108371490 [Rhagoletis zephyria]|uniref:uncharacterized protein LOC108371490 n=1 Tax=Rhagoletis zephyria TaxID=28612 RepID=UPI00081126B6|nr:PREDICTED: uncharacterized protein LOC108371490 [Rhagoletis zephyria]XP_017482552.1 PREDICTED: uncharacterized protein LOC108371490 [Rhagoletis zephyria]XP_017482553.1 PREDICTED: uncharacterized protein LOC108371490 [Rhagoletis zephyria]XP_017482554.1 PREDICTED: uncharacterized protein LOC108371490 [Rhagoletis zephyria]XP_017482555.1 PREDICTED: uncharacterized protein LOC108371490 [Rhagoletis zephyria]XP_017482556.1 PREDICTED: uncharacterized protein LOC108371490 [Rhagoletis zephyria]XP_01
MPRNAAKKLINDEVCLPIQTAKTATTETIIIINSENDIRGTTPTKSTTTTQPAGQEKKKSKAELEQTQQQTQKQTLKTKLHRRKRRRRQRTKKRTSTGCAKPPSETTTTAVIKVAADKNPTKSRTSKKFYCPPYFSTLYPVVIETCLEAELQATSASSKSGTTASNTSAAGVGASSTGVGATSTPRPPVSAGGKRQLRRRRSVTNFSSRKNRARAKAAAAAAAASAAAKVRVNSKETAARLATLRNRKKPEEDSAKNKRKQQKSAAPGTRGTTSSSDQQVKRHAAWYNLDEALLNKIEPLEVEVKKAGSKRKRDSSVAVARKRNSITHKHTPPPAVHLSPAGFDFPALNCIGAPAVEIIASTSIVKVSTTVTAELTGVSTSTSITTTALAPTTSTTSSASAPISTVGSGKKRGRCSMSLYERRYQTTDAEARAGAGVVTNGYLSSTRTSSASSSAVHSDADNTQDISQQYYMPVASVSSSGLAGSSSSGSGVVTGVQLGNGSALNHAPSMATLCNIGNTCYLNSVVYTLRFAPQFLHNLHHLIVDLSSIQQCIARQRAAKSSSLGRGISAVQLENARSWSSKDLAALEQNALMSAGVGGGGVGGCGGGIGQKSSHQMLTERLHELYQCLHRNELAESTEPFHADTLLHAVQDVNAIFEGNQQQDAHEFLMCLLNSIRETCQLLIKAIGEYPDLIMNGYIRNPDELDAYTIERDALTGGVTATTSSSNALAGGSSASTATNATNSSSSSLSTSNITKASFFSRKSKRKEESKNSKNSRLQSPLKDGQSGGLQATSNSLFYLNSVDLSGASATAANASASSPSATVKGVANNTSAGNDSNSELSSPVSMLKDKERLAEKIRELGLDFFSEDFEGVTVSTTKCLSCETVTEQKESMIDIAVPVPISGYDVADYSDKPSAFIQNSCVTREFFRGENKYRCEQCTGYTEAIRSISYEVLPRLLIIQLSRFSGGMEKINSYIPTSFTLQCFCAKCCELSDANKLHIYKLYSVITHVGATMSVGHYIAYTCSLEWANEYLNCPKDRRNANSNSGSQQMGGQANGLSNNSLYPLGGGSAASGGGSTPSERSSPGTQAASAASAAASVLASSGSSLMKKMKFGRSKASSSGDMSKNVKSLNGITSKTITNGIGKLSMNTTCHSLSCCATRICSVQQQQLQQQQHQLSASNSELSEETLQNGTNHASASMSVSGSSNAGGGGSVTGSAASSTTSGYSSYPAGYGSTGRGGTKASAFGGYASSCGSLSAAGSSNGEPIWYMCDDDKIKAMTQREFEELLSPARKITVTPYLLFYARFDLQTSTPPSAKSTSTAAQQSSWSNENLTQNPSATAAALHKM